jgi:unsaturated chondroitin disaccharide hydrolase
VDGAGPGGVGKWQLSAAGDWTGGFSVAALWLAARHGMGERREAVEAMRRLRPALESASAFRGFVFQCGAALGDVLLADREARELAVTAARRLAAAAHPVTGVIPLGEPGLVVQGSAGGLAYVDAVGPTVALLAHAADRTGDEGPRELAGRLAVWTLDALVRPDGSMAQAATYDEDSGAVRSVYTGEQGLRRDSTWARSQAWGLLAAGTAALRCPAKTGAVLVHGRAVADWWIGHVQHDGWIPRWDFDAPADDPADTSAAAIAAAGLLRLAAAEQHNVDGTSARYAAAAEATLNSLLRLVTPTYHGDPRPPGMLTEGCYHRPHGLAVRAELVWGDYYLVECLLASRGQLDVHQL